MIVLMLAACNGPEKKPEKPPPSSLVDTGRESGSTTDTGSQDPDSDGDGFPASADCDDTDSAAYPGAPDLCGDDRVTDCDRTSDDGLVTIDGTATFTDLHAALDAAS